MIPLDPFPPKEVTAHDREAGLCTVSQFPTQAVRMVSADGPSQFISPLEDLRTTSTQAMVGKSDSIASSRNHSLRDEAKQQSPHWKRARIQEDEGHDILSGVHLSDPVCNMTSNGDNILRDEVSHVVPDVAAAIEDLLEQASKVKSDPISFG